MDLIHEEDYGAIDPLLYDATISLVVPQYATLHDTMARLVVLHLSETRRHRSNPTVLDLGSGTGAEAIRVLTECPSVSVIAVDRSSTANSVHKKKLRTLELTSRCHIMRMEFPGAQSIRSRLARAARAVSAGRQHKFDIVLTAFAFHHFSPTEKRRAYQLAYDVLHPGGLFLNADLYSYSSKRLSQASKTFDNRWIKERLARPPEWAHEARRIPLSIRQHIAKEWLRHYKECNWLEPMEDGPRSPGQISMITDAGFSDVGVPYRYWQTGILWTRK